jgi:crotonobetainyl-CoA:carnitine CoA-transferase CaiB-like acyl-CoA transferase
MDVCQRAGVIAGAVQNAEDRVEYDPQLRHRNVFPVLDHPAMGPWKYDGYPVRLSRTPATPRRGAPLWREHNPYVFKQILHLTNQEIAALEAEGVV